MKLIYLVLAVIFLFSCQSGKKDISRQRFESAGQDSLPVKTEAEYEDRDITFQIHLEGFRCDSLSMGGENIEKTRVHKIDGETTDGYNWKFMIPDSIYHIVPKIFFSPKFKNESSDITHMLTFFSYFNGDTLNYYQFLPLSPKIVEVYAKYSDTKVHENTPMIRVEANELIYETLYVDRCEIPLDKNSDLEVQGLYPGFPYTSVDDYNMHENNVAQCLEIIAKYPDSHYLIGCIVEHRTEFTKENLQKIFTAFSIKNRRSDFGKIIDAYLDHYFVFSNMKLPDYENDTPEFMIRDSTKMNLIVFSASWCGPCHEMIPALKEIYSDLKNRLEITYISMDEEKTADNWRKLMKEKEIPWRSLMAKNDIKAVKEKYNPTGSIPFAFMVYPNKTVEIIDIRQSDQKEKLYAACKGL